MSDMKHIIEPERQGLWIAVTFIIALIAFVVALVGIIRINSTAAATQLEILTLNQKIEDTKTGSTMAAPAAPEQQPETK